MGARAAITPLTSDMVADQTTVHAIIAYANQGTHEPHGPPLAYAYGTAIAGRGETHFGWGAGYAKEPLPHVCAAVRRLLEWRSSGVQLRVYAPVVLSDRLSVLNPKTAHKKAMGPELLRIAQALSEGSFMLETYRLNSEPYGWGPARQEANKGLGWITPRLRTLMSGRTFSEWEVLATDRNAD